MTRPPLSRESIVAAAVAIADADGVKQLSMRKLAAALGYEVMSLYNHVANKRELLALMLDSVAGEFSLPADRSEPVAAIRALAVSTHDVFLAHRWVPDLWLQYLPGPNRVRAMETLLALLDATGLNERVVHLGFHAVDNHVLGHAMQMIGMKLDTADDTEQRAGDFLDSLSSADHPHTIAHVHQHLAGDTGNSFEVVLDLILDGLIRMND